MGHFKVDAQSKPGVLMLELQGALTPEQIQAFVAAHNGAVEAMHGAPYRVFCDIRQLVPLSPEAAAHFQRAKEFSAAQPNFQGSAVLVTSSLVAMQHRRTSVESGVMSSELITDSETACWAHLAKVQRHR